MLKLGARRSCRTASRRSALPYVDDQARVVIVSERRASGQRGSIAGATGLPW
jgi:hypothetical protein